MRSASIPIQLNRGPLTERAGRYGKRIDGGRAGAVSSHGRCGEVRLELAVYVLGALDPGGRSVVDRHIADCADCRDELAGLAGLPGLLRRISPPEAFALAGEDTATGLRPDLPSGPALRQLLTGVSRDRRRHLRAWGASPQTGVSATVRYATRPWGVQLLVQVKGVPVGTTCVLDVISRHGRVTTAGGWTIAGGQARWYPASSPVRLADTQGFAVASGRRILVNVPVQVHRGASATTRPPEVRDQGIGESRIEWR